MYLTHKRVECCVFDHVRVGRFGICLSFRIKLARNQSVLQSTVGLSDICKARPRKAKHTLVSHQGSFSGVTMRSAWGGAFDAMVQVTGAVGAGAGLPASPPTSTRELENWQETRHLLPRR